jgi:hypothetical protein
MKYALWKAADQTIVYLTESGHTTTKHFQAKLWDNKEQVEAIRRVRNASIPALFPIGHSKAGQPIDDRWRLICSVEIEEVPDEAEFRAREDTW